MTPRISIRYAFAALLAVFSTMPAVAADTPADAQKRPNIVFMMTDNLGWGEIGVYGGGILRGAETPRLDALAAEGMRLLNFNVEPQCTPSRSALMTGRHPIRSGTTKVVWGMLYGLTQWEVTIAELLSEQGYATGFYGKWHLGDIEGRLPTNQGFDEWYGLPNTTDESLYDLGIDFDPEEVHLPYIMAGVRGEASEKVKRYDVEARREIDAELTRRAIDFMERSVEAGKPFFAFVPYTQVHLPTVPHPDFAGRTGNGDFADVLEEVDHRAGQVLDAIDRLDIRDNTIVIWTSDNGPEDIFPHNGTAGPWRGTYFTALEGSLRAPFLIRWPGKVPAGSVSNEIVHMVDMLPTLARVAGAEVPNDRMIDGVDQLDFLTGRSEASAREGFPVFNGDELFAYKWRNWKVHFAYQDRMLGKVERGVMMKIYHLLRDPKEEYDLIANNVADAAWVAPPVLERVLEFRKTLAEEPPIALGTPDPYSPRGRE